MILNLFIIFFSAFLFSNKIIFDPLKKKNNSTLFIKPIIITPEFTEFLLLELIHNLYKNYIFDITYFRISNPGKYFKFFGFKAFKNIFTFTFLSCILFIIQFLKFIFNFKENINFSEFIYLNYDNMYDTRKLLFVNDTWVHNPSIDILSKLLKDKYNIPINIIDKTYKKLFDVLKTTASTPNQINFTYCDHLFKDKTMSSHFVANNFTNNKTLGYMTDFNKAVNNNFYDKKIYIPYFKGPYKDSCLLQTNLEGIKYYQKTFKLPSTRLSEGLCHSEIFNITNKLSILDKLEYINIQDKILSDANSFIYYYHEFKEKSLGLGISEEDIDIFYKILLNNIL